MSNQARSLEAVLDEERREVLALLERNPATARARHSVASGGRSPSPFTPRSPMRSMLDIGEDLPSPPLPQTSSPGAAKKSPPRPASAMRSMLDVDSAPAPAVVRSMLDVDKPPSATVVKQVLSNPTSPIESSFRTHAGNNMVHPRSFSDAATRPADFGPRSSATRLLSPDPTLDYQFSDIITNNSGQALPKRAAQGGRRPAGSSMAEVMRDLNLSATPGDSGSMSSSGMRLHNKSKSPHNRLGVRSNSPHASKLGPPRHLSPAGRAMLTDGQTVDIHNAYRRLSDANLALSGGSLSELGRRKRSDELADSGRLAKIYYTPDGDELPEESSEDNGATSSEEEGERGRKAARSYESGKADEEADAANSGLDPGKRKTLSLLAAAEEERIEVASKQPKYQYRSLLDEPEITVTGPSGGKAKQSKGGVHPATSFDQPPESGSRTPLDSDEEADLTDIKRAQKLSFAMTSIMSYPEAHRAIRIIYRGEYAKIVHDMEAEERRLRKYLVATDLSDESTHALEWAIGTVLRDGDTLIAIYCVDEELGIAANESALVPDDPKAMKEQAAAINTVATSSKMPVGPSGLAVPLQHYRHTTLARNKTDTASVSPSPAPSSRERSKSEEERLRAVQDITDRINKLLRKTQLQVRVIVEVLHCKNPKHLITEVIDLVNPTLVILGSRGRSALKGVILGSFSNYLVTKSSVPVMVARKRLRKQSKYKRPVFRQVNNLSNPAARSLANAKID